MNTEIVAQIIAESLQERPEFAGVPVWEPTDGEKEGDKARLVNEISPTKFPVKSCTGNGTRKRSPPPWCWT